MATAQPDKTGMHILLKLASLVIILAGIHAAADIIVQLLLALFFAIVLNPLVTWFIRRGVKRPLAITIVVVVMLIVLTALVGVLAASLNEFIAMLPKYSKELTRKEAIVKQRGGSAWQIVSVDSTLPSALSVSQCQLNTLSLAVCTPTPFTLTPQTITKAL